MHLHVDEEDILMYNMVAVNMAWPPTEKSLIIHDLVSAFSLTTSPVILSTHSVITPVINFSGRFIILRNPESWEFWVTWPGANFQGWSSWRISPPSCLLSSNRLRRRLGSGSFSCEQTRGIWSNCNRSKGEEDEAGGQYLLTLSNCSLSEIVITKQGIDLLPLYHH